MEPKSVKVGNKCNNNCIFCSALNIKANYDKSLEEIKKDLNELKEKNYSEIILPCNSDIRKDFFEMLEYIKDLDFKITLKTNGRMFYYKDFCDKTVGLIDNYRVILCTVKNDNINDIMTNSKGTLHQSMKGLEYVSSMDKNTRVIIPLTRTNSTDLDETISLLNYIKYIIVRVVNPHPEIYKQLNKLRNKKKITIIDLPYEVKLEITPRCNLECGFCYNKNSFSRNLEELPKDKIITIIDKIADVGIRRIRFTGGEPFLRKDFFKILSYAKSRGLYVIINTNSTLIKKKDIPRFSGIVDLFLLPIHSLDRKDIMKKTELIETMKRNNIRIVLNTVLIKDNINQLERYFELVNELGIDWFLARPVPTLNNKMPIINTDVRLLIEKLMNLKDKYGWINVDGIPFCAYDPEKVRLFSNGAKECGIFNKLVVDPTGNIKPCYSVDENLGNALKTNILDAWKHELAVNIRQLRLLPNICKECKYVYECLGGCRFAAKLVNGSYASLDPLAMPKKYKEKLFG